ncbi:MAG: SDR family oxidoreductase [Ferruginibacter sp.]|nr:SDR family oxidoreductase [Ferruginibacter sp.]
MNDFFRGKTIAITGGSDGIGKALTQILLAAGANVSTCARSAAKLQIVKNDNIGKPLLCLPCDVSIYEDCKNFIHTTIQTFGGIDILINNAGISMHAELRTADLEVFKKVMDINYFGTVYCTKLALESIISKKGTIVGVSSIAGYRGLPGRSGYSASKFAVNGWLEAVRTELMTEGVNVMWVCPGFTKSNIRNAALDGNAKAQGESPIDESKLMTSEECAQHILNAIVKRKRTLVLTFKGKQAVFMNKFFAKLTDKLTYNFFYKNGKLIK